MDPIWSLSDSSCVLPYCSLLEMLRPPLDAILSLPPPPLPPSLLSSLENGENILLPQCQWTNKKAIEFIEMPKHELREMEDTWFHVAIASALAVILIAALVFFVLMRTKRSSDSRKAPLTTLADGRSSARAPQPAMTAVSLQPASPALKAVAKRPRTLWSELGGDESRYTIEHTRSHARKQRHVATRAETVHLLPMRHADHRKSHRSADTRRQHSMPGSHGSQVTYCPQDYRHQYLTHIHSDDDILEADYFRPAEHFYEEPLPVIGFAAAEKLSVGVPAVYGALQSYQATREPHLYENPQQRHHASCNGAAHPH